MKKKQKRKNIQKSTFQSKKINQIHTNSKEIKIRIKIRQFMVFKKLENLFEILSLKKQNKN